MSILETGAGPNFVRKDVLLASSTNWIKHGHLTDIRNAIKHPQKFLGTINLTMQLASYNLLVNFFGCDSLVAPTILGAEFYDNFVQAIQPGDKVVELDDKTSIPILYNGLRIRQSSQQENIRIPYVHVTDDETPFSLIGASATIDIRAQNQAWVMIHAKHHGLVVIEPEPKLFDKHELICTNGVAQV